MSGSTAKKTEKTPLSDLADVVGKMPGRAADSGASFVVRAAITATVTLARNLRPPDA